MTDVCAEAKLNDREKALLDVADNEVDHWHQQAKAGDQGALETLVRWAHAKARHYYCCIRATGKEALLLVDAEALASDFIVLFMRKWGDIRSVIAYTNTVLQRSVTYYRKRRVRIAEPDLEKPDPTPPPEEKGLTDEQWRQLWIYRRAYDNARPTMQKLLQLYVQEEPSLTYHEMAQQTGLTEGAAKMRIKRFRDAMYREFERFTRKRPSVTT